MVQEPPWPLAMKSVRRLQGIGGSAGKVVSFYPWIFERTLKLGRVPHRDENVMFYMGDAAVPRKDHLKAEPPNSQFI